MNKIILAAAALLATAATASASDVSPKSDFAGFYVGAYGGYAHGVAFTSSMYADGSMGGILGGKAGYNFEIGDGFIIGPAVDFVSIGYNVSDEVALVGAASILAGYDFGGFMPYVKAGVAYDGDIAGPAASIGFEVMITDRMAIDIGYDVAGFKLNDYVGLGVGTARFGLNFHF
jgi:outer membrane immunogenic protein